LACLGNPEGRVSFGSLVTRGFRLSGVKCKVIS
jgi:hypothetical protein